MHGNHGLKWKADQTTSSHCDSIPGFVTSIKQLEKKPNFRIYPYPSQAVFQIELENQAQAAYQFELFDISGRLVYEEQFRESKRLDLGHLPEGIYHYRIVAHEGEIMLISY